MNKNTQLVLVALLLGACSQAPAPPASAPLPPVASLQEVMASIVDPAADALWESVSSETTSKGIEEHQPRSDAEWQAVRTHAVILQEAGTLLQMEGRPVTHGGRKTEDAHVQGVSSAEQVKQAIDGKRAGWVANARALQAVAGEALAAIDKKDAAQLLAVGGKLDAVCEGCHSVYWYPNAKAPQAGPWPAALKAPQ